MHPLLDGELARQRIDERLARARQRYALMDAPARRRRTSLRAHVGLRLVEVGIRLWLSGHRRRPEEATRMAC